MISVRPASFKIKNILYKLLTQFVWSTTPDLKVYDCSFPALVSDPNTHFLVALTDTTIVGYALAVSQLTLYANGAVVVLQELMVDPEFRSQGIGKALVDQVVSDAKASGATEITVPTRRAREYYPKFGFEEVAGYFRMRL